MEPSAPPDVSTQMKTVLSILRPAALAFLAGTALALSVGHASPPPLPHEADGATGERPGEIELADRFPDAPYGVDPVVTGPVSREFREQQKVAGCDDARWPHIPAVCFPG